MYESSKKQFLLFVLFVEHIEQRERFHHSALKGAKLLIHGVGSPAITNRVVPGRAAGNLSCWGCDANSKNRRRFGRGFGEGLARDNSSDLQPPHRKGTWISSRVSSLKHRFNSTELTENVFLFYKAYWLSSVQYIKKKTLCLDLSLCLLLIFCSLFLSCSHVAGKWRDLGWGRGGTKGVDWVESEPSNLTQQDSFCLHLNYTSIYVTSADKRTSHTCVTFWGRRTIHLRVRKHLQIRVCDKRKKNTQDLKNEIYCIY